MPAGFMIADIFPNKEFTFAPITPPPDPIQEPIFNFPLIPAYSDVKREGMEGIEVSMTHHIEPRVAQKGSIGISGLAEVD